MEKVLFAGPTKKQALKSKETYNTGGMFMDKLYALKEKLGRDATKEEAQEIYDMVNGGGNA